jgi:glycine/D-amino acid oxidase-like deaminating enzyme
VFGRPLPDGWWVEDAALGADGGAALEGADTADVCIVGGGFTGLWTALRVKEHEPSADVVVLEARYCGAGASGRNGGFALSMWHNFVGLRALCGTDEALRITRASADAVGTIGHLLVKHELGEHFRADGWLWTASNASQEGAWEATVTAVEGQGEAPFTRLDPAQVQHRAGSSAHLGGVLEAVAATIHPGHLVRALRREVLAKGVRIFERSPMTGLDRSSPLGVRTPRGRITAGRVVIATNAWAARMHELRRAFVIVASDIVATEPIPDELVRLGWTDGVGISDSRLMVHYYRTTPDGRIVFGKGGCGLAFGSRADLGASASRARVVARSLHRFYPSLDRHPVAGYWTGPIDRPLDGLPFFTQLGRPDLICGVGYAGNGVVPTVLGGRILASMALDRQDEWSACGLVRPVPRGLPPEPIRYVGGRIVRAAVARKESAQDAGRPPRRTDTLLASLAPAGLVPLADAAD